jgi:broad specificity phosphatase PhoE
MADLWEQPIDCLYSSRLPRALQTIAPLSAKVSLPAIEDSGLVELDYRGDAALFHTEIVGNRDFKFKGGESIDEANHRFFSTLKKIAERHPASAVAVSTHGTVLSEFCVQQFGFPKDFFFTVSYPDIFEIEYTNDAGFNFIRRVVDFLPETSENAHIICSK